MSHGHDDGFGAPPFTAFGDGRCACPSSAELGVAAFRGETIEPRCELHQADEIRANNQAQERATAQRHLAREQAIFDELRAPAPPAVAECSCNLLGDLEAALTGNEIPDCSVHRPPPPAPTNNTPLGGDTLTQQVLQMFPGATLDSTQSH